jgi:hypothetical protein
MLEWFNDPGNLNKRFPMNSFHLRLATICTVIIELTKQAADPPSRRRYGFHSQKYKFIIMKDI